jgi:hypothetical protein
MNFDLFAQLEQKIEGISDNMDPCRDHDEQKSITIAEPAPHEEPVRRQTRGFEANPGAGGSGGGRQPLMP